MHVTHILEKQAWEEQIGNFPEANFLQSWQWGVFQESLGKRVLRIFVQKEGSTEAGLAQVIVEPAKRGRYAAVAGGPLVNWQDTGFVTNFFDTLKAEAKKEGCVFLRFRPQVVETEVSDMTLQKIGARLAPMHLTADLTLQLNITQGEQEILAQMRKNTRYEVKKAEKLGITTRVSSDASEVLAFHDEQLRVAERHNFVPFSLPFFQKQFEAFAADGQVALVHSYLDDQLLASAFILFYNGEAVYHYGISTEANAKQPGAYATQWRAVQEAKARGCSTYNFWGIAPETATTHRFAGVSLFKRGFGGQEVAYLPAHDLVLSPLYWVNWGFEMIRKRLRRL